jgi:hypothetical protein
MNKRKERETKFPLTKEHAKKFSFDALNQYLLIKMIESASSGVDYSPLSTPALRNSNAQLRKICQSAKVNLQSVMNEKSKNAILKISLSERVNNCMEVLAEIIDLSNLRQREFIDTIREWKKGMPIDELDNEIK